MIRNIKKIHDDARLHLRVVLRTMIPVTARVTARYSGSCALKCRDAIVSAVSGAPRNNGNMGGQSAGDSFCMIRQIIGQPRQHLLTARRKACQGCSTGLSCLLARGSCATLMCEVHHYPPKEMAADVGASHAASSGHARWHCSATFKRSRLSGSGRADAFDRLPGCF